MTEFDPIIAAAEQVAKERRQSDPWMSVSDALFMAWREGFLKDWARAEATLDQKAVKLARKLAADGADRIVFKQPLAYQKDVTGHEWLVRDMVYYSAPFWFAAYYELAFLALYGPYE